MLTPIAEEEKSVASPTEQLPSVQMKEEFPLIDDECAISILESLMKGEYDENIYELWNTVNGSQFNVRENEVCFAGGCQGLVFILSSRGYLEQIDLLVFPARSEVSGRDFRCRERHLTIFRNITRFCRTMFPSGSIAVAATLRRTLTGSILPIANISTL